MRYATLFLFTVLILILATSCHRRTVVVPVQVDYIITGTAGGYTAVDAKTRYFKIAEDLKKDTSKLYQGHQPALSEFRWDVVLPMADYTKAVGLLSSLPEELLKRNGQVIGRPMVDASYTDLRARYRGVDYSWRFEADLDKESAGIRDFVNRLQTDLPNK